MAEMKVTLLPADIGIGFTHHYPHDLAAITTPGHSSFPM